MTGENKHVTFSNKKVNTTLKHPEEITRIALFLNFSKSNYQGKYYQY